MNYALLQLQLAIAADGGHAAVKPGHATPLHKRENSRDFAEIVSKDIYEHMQMHPHLRDAMDRISTSTADADKKVKAALPLVTKAAKSLYEVAASGDFKFDVLFPAATLTAIAKHMTLRQA